MGGWNSRLWRRVRVAPGVTLNLSKSGVSFSGGMRGAHVTVGPRGVRQTVGLPGTGLFLTNQQSWAAAAPEDPSGLFRTHTSAGTATVHLLVRRAHSDPVGAGRGLASFCATELAWLDALPPAEADRPLWTSWRHATIAAGSAGRALASGDPVAAEAQLDRLAIRWHDLNRVADVTLTAVGTTTEAAGDTPPTHWGRSTNVCAGAVAGMALLIVVGFPLNTLDDIAAAAGIVIGCVIGAVLPAPWQWQRSVLWRN